MRRKVFVLAGFCDQHCPPAHLCRLQQLDVGEMLVFGRGNYKSSFAELICEAEWLEQVLAIVKSTLAFDSVFKVAVPIPRSLDRVRIVRKIKSRHLRIRLDLNDTFLFDIIAVKRRVLMPQVM